MARMGVSVTAPQLEHLQRVVSWWTMLADISFADLLLFAPIRDDRMVVIGQIRPSTAQTLYHDDEVGRIVDEVDRPLVFRSWRSAELIDGEINLATGDGTRAQVQGIPVRHDGEIIGVMTRETRPDLEKFRLFGQLESSYLAIFNRFARMIADGRFPYVESEVDPEHIPRVGDGALVLDDDARIRFASPNGLSTLHRIGFAGAIVGRRLSDLGLAQGMVRDAMLHGRPMAEEIDRGGRSIFVVAVPLSDTIEERGALVMMRDVTEVRSRDQLLMSKDATIREIHHRVKNNLQTISSLLRIQGRRVESAEAKSAIDDSVRRIRAISLVHETLAQESGEDISLREIVDQLTKFVESSLVDVGRRIILEVVGDVGTAPAEVVTPLAVVINELLQNVVDHAYPDGRFVSEDGVVGRVGIELHGSNRAGLQIMVADDGVGLPLDFDQDRSGGLGTSIVNTLVTSELGGILTMENLPDGGAIVTVTIPPRRID